MAIYVKGNNKINNIFVNVNGSKGRIKSVWGNRNTIPTKVFGQNIDDPYEMAPVTAYSNWNYTLDDTNNIITLNYYIGSETDVIVYSNYVINGKTYKTQLKSNLNAVVSEPYMFNGLAQNNCKKIKTIKFSKNINTSDVSSMAYMFFQCSGLTYLDILGLDTSNVTNMSHMFSVGEINNISQQPVSNLTNITFGTKFITSKVTDMYGMFLECNKLTNIDLSGFDTSNVIDMSYMFEYCLELKNIIGINNLDTSNVTDFNHMFAHAYEIQYLDLSNWNTKNGINFSSMFYRCEQLKSINLQNWNTTNATKMSQMFQEIGCTILDLTSFNTNKVTTMRMMFYDSSKLIRIYVGSTWTTENLKKTDSTATDGTYKIFYGCGTSSVTYI